MTQKQLIKKYGRRETTPEESDQARDLIYGDTDNFTTVMLAMRERAMEQLGLNVEEDFLEDLLRERAPKAYNESGDFRINACNEPNRYPVSAMIASAALSIAAEEEEDVFSYLRSALIDDVIEWN